MGFEINRKEFRLAIDQGIEECGPDSHLAVVIVKIRNLYKINENHGYDKADEIISASFKSLQKTSKKTSISFRIDSSSFGLLVKGLKFPKLIEVGLERLLGTVRGPFLFDAEEIALDADIGAVIYPPNGNSADQLLMRAEYALQTCKTSTQSFVLHDTTQHNEFNQWQMEADLKSALIERQLEVHYQPQIKLADNSTAGFESLLRWNHPVHGQISPERFIPLAEASGMMNEITEWVLMAGLRESMEFIQGGADFTLSVNVSPSTLLDPGFLFAIDSAVSMWGASHEHLIIEITESVLMEDFKTSRDILARLRDIGIRISIDDFGTGYSSLAYFKQLPVDELKIDRTFVTNMVRNPGDHKLVEVIIELAHKFDMHVVAEGVEDLATLEDLRELGCDIAQGYLISKALDIDNLKPWLDKRARTAPAGASL
jgi:EAL domain-containing protein (putative c-di-GMP-specific phosphodiesterase class I)/GGDEF domain-containing protein